MKNFIVSVLGKFILTNSSTIDDLMNKEGAECVTVPATMVKQLRCHYGDDIANGRELFFALRAQKAAMAAAAKAVKKGFDEQVKILSTKKESWIQDGTKVFIAYNKETLAKIFITSDNLVIRTDKNGVKCIRGHKEGAEKDRWYPLTQIANIGFIQSAINSIDRIKLEEDRAAKTNAYLTALAAYEESEARFAA